MQTQEQRKELIKEGRVAKREMRDDEKRGKNEGRIVNRRLAVLQYIGMETIINY